MPIYVYKNLTTGERFEVEQRITEPPLEAHPETGDPVKRLVQPVGIAFKGSGFYATDSRASSRPASAGAEAGTKDGSGASDAEGTKKDTKAEGGASGTGKDAKTPSTSTAAGASATAGKDKS